MASTSEAATPLDALEKAREAAALRDVGHARLKARHYAQAVEAFAAAVAVAPDDEATRLALGVALQGARRHEEALACFQRVANRSPENITAELHSAFSLLALGRALPAREAALRVIERAPRAASAHCALGQAEVALGRTEAAEKALLAGLEIDPSSADLWALLGAARKLAGNAQGAEAALQTALRLDPGHPAARSVLAPKVVGRSRELKIWNPTESRAALGLAVDYLSKKAVFGRLPFGEWSRTLAHQVGRGQQVFVVDGDERVLGYLGWALTDPALAEQWLRGLSALSDDQCQGGDCAILNAWAADSKPAARLLVATAREIFKDKSALYFKRFYRDGRARPMRLSINAFVAGHVARLGANG